MKTTGAKIGVVVAAVLLIAGIGGVVYALTRVSEKKTDTTAQKTAQAEKDIPDKFENADPLLPTIVFTNDGFSRKEYRFPAGTDIKVDNQSDMDMQFSSDSHPTHEEHSELNMELLGAGESGTFTPPGKGTYTFHDHINDQFTGTLIIE